MSNQKKASKKPDPNLLQAAINKADGKVTVLLLLLLNHPSSYRARECEARWKRIHHRLIATSQKYKEEGQTDE